MLALPLTCDPQRMRTLPRQDRRSRTGSSLRGAPIRAHRERLVRKAVRPVAQVMRAYTEACRKLLSRKQVQRIAAALEEVKHEWRQASLKARGNGKKLGALKDDARRAFRRLAARTVPRFKAWQKLRTAFLRDLTRVTSTAFSGVAGPRLSVAWGDLLPLDPPPGATTFRPPFPAFDVQLIDDARRVSRDDSFSTPAAGLLVNNLSFHKDEDTPVIIGLYGLIRPDTATSLSSCGGNYTLPKTGRIQVNAAVRNHYNKAVLTLRDRFGFSYGKVGVRVSLFVDVIRNNRDVTHLPTVMLDTHLDSDGDDKSLVTTDIDNSMPFQLVAVSAQDFQVGERVQVMVGSEVFISSEQDDMDSTVEVTCYWQVNQITIGVQ